MKALIEFFIEHVSQGIQSTYPELTSGMEFICKSHLDPNNYAMSNHEIPRDDLFLLLNEGRYDQVIERFSFEKTECIRGVIRVMVRTHLNRQYVGYATRGYSDRTLAKRVMLPFTGEFDYVRMVDHGNFADCFERAAIEAPEEFDQVDLQAISALRRLRGKQRTSASVAKKFGIHDSWAKVLTGIYSGLLYLHSEYEFNARSIWAAMDDCRQNASQSQTLIRRFTQIHQYGPALAGSFLADLGHQEFVKADTHVKHSVAAILGQERVSDQDAIAYVYRLAEALKIPPRMLDKIFFIGCSGRLYLFNLKVNDLAGFKRRFLHWLREEPSLRAI